VEINIYNIYKIISSMKIPYNLKTIKKSIIMQFRMRKNIFLRFCIYKSQESELMIPSLKINHPD